jgi:hypothetical protein
VVFIEPVVSKMTAMFSGYVDPPTPTAVDWAVSVMDLAELTPRKARALMKYVGMVTVCVTLRAFVVKVPPQEGTFGMVDTQYG